jgi:hypothetical protein
MVFNELIGNFVAIQGGQHSCNIIAVSKILKKKISRNFKLQLKRAVIPKGAILQ